MLKTLDPLVSLCKRRGYVFPGSEIYGGLSACWDYGPLGVQFKMNVKRGLVERHGSPARHSGFRLRYTNAI